MIQREKERERERKSERDIEREKERERGGVGWDQKKSELVEAGLSASLSYKQYLTSCSVICGWPMRKCTLANFFTDTNKF